MQIATKLNRSCLVHGDISYILPCLGRIEIDNQASGPQAVSVEDSTACIHGSRGVAEPCSDYVRSEPWIVAGLAKATLPLNPRIDWDSWVADYGRIRDAISQTYPDNFHEFNLRMWEPGGFHRPLPARQRRWLTKTGKANFIAPKALTIDADPAQRDVLRLTTFRSQGQFNTTVYAYRDRYRGVFGTRMAVFMNHNDMDQLGLSEGKTVSLVTEANDGVNRQVDGYIVHAYNIPEGCVGGYYLECNPLLPVWHHAEKSLVPAFKGVRVRIQKRARAAQADE